MKTSKILVILFLGALPLVSCDKDDKEKDENEREIAISELPKVVSESIARDYPAAKLIEADEITEDNGSLTYDVEIENSGAKMEVKYDASGKFLGTESDDDDDDDED